MNEDEKDAMVANLKCDNCRSAQAKFECTRCHNSFYCSLHCQRHHWTGPKKHKDHCQEFKAQAAEVLKATYPKDFDTSLKKAKPCITPNCPNNNPFIVSNATQPLGIALPCHHHLCLGCIRQHKSRITGSGHGQCPLCQRPLDKSIEDMILDHTQRLRDNAKHPSLPKARQDEYKHQAVVALTRALPELEAASFGTTSASWDEHKVFRANIVLAILHTELKQFDTAAELLHKLLDYAEASENTAVKNLRCELHRKLGHALEGSNQWSEAVQHYQTAFDMDGGKKITKRVMDVKGRLAHCYNTMGDTEQAKETAEEIVLLNKNYPGVHQTKAEVLEKEGALEDARKEMLMASILETPWDPYHRQAILEKLDHIEEQVLMREEIAKLEAAFMEIWRNVLLLTEQETFDDAPKAWSSIRHRFEMGSGYESDNDESGVAVRRAAARVLAQTEEELKEAEGGDDEVVEIDELREDEAVDAEVETHLPPLEHENYGGITVTKEVLKWHKDADGKFRELFVKKLQKLADGDWGITTAKLLVGSQTKIYETYLENSKGGHRILWIRPNGSIQLRYVVIHDKVSRYMRLIDAAGVRTQEQLFPASMLAPDEVMGAFGSSKDYEKGEIQIDPRADVPLKLYELTQESIIHLNERDWIPPLYMTPKENAIVETKGSVCVLGRSGTGKTVCISSRIHRDRHYWGSNDNFSQLFVARSRRICVMVSDMVGGPASGEIKCNEVHYWTYDRLLMRCEQTLIGRHAHHYTERKKMTFAKFKAFIVPSNCSLDPLIAWKQIRTFIKGSILAAEKGSHLTREQYLALGERECRLGPDQRNIAYDVFERYKRIAEADKYWDDIDRVTRILQKIHGCMRGGNAKDLLDKLVHTKLYVDECQDYTQCELALFLRLCRNDGLFLAGDPAQSVEEGIDFRFEDVRMVADRVYNERAQEEEFSSPGRRSISTSRANIPNKPEVLRVNFRSHAGVLHLASGILETMSEAFKGSFKNLGQDEGFFRGPRPSVLSELSLADLKELVMKLQGVAVLTLDENGSTKLEDVLGENVNVLTIRESKGLEFDVVLIVNFFSDLSVENQQHWKTLLLNEHKSDIQAEAPEVETQLKLLYTGITRCCKRLIFAETNKESSSPAFEAFKKWGYIRKEKDDRYVELQKLDSVAENVMTSQNWTKNGIQFAMRAEESEDLVGAKKNLKRAVDSFREAADDENLRRAEIHLSSIALRAQLTSEPGTIENNFDTVEPFVSGIAELIQCGLHLEASKLCYDLMDRMTGDDNQYARDQIKKRLLSRLPELDF